MRIPKSKLGKFINYLRNFHLARLLLACMHNGYLVETGWIRSFMEKKCIDENGEAIPWAPYPYVNFLKDHITSDMTIFEFGSGFSSLFFAKRGKEVHCLEHDQSWIDKMELHKNKKVQVHIKELDESYEKTIQELPQKFDLIVVDGRRRVKCIKAAVDKLTERGILVLDDSDREEYAEGIEFMTQLGFKCINFWGPAPLVFLNRKTTIFFKQL